MTSKKATVIFIPGAWHLPDAYSEVAGILEAAGYTTILVNLESVGAKEPLSGFEPDVAKIRQIVEQACDADQDVMLFMHSYGGIPGTESVKGLGKVERRKDGKPGGVIQLIYCCAFVLPEGASLLGGLGNQPLPWFIIEDDGMVVHAGTPEQIFYNDLDDEQAAKWVSMLKPFSYKTFSSQVTYAGWRDVPSTYFYCEQDQAIPVAVQRKMVEDSKVPFNTETLDASHSPFLSMPKEVAEAVRRAAGEAL